MPMLASKIKSMLIRRIISIKYGIRLDSSVLVALSTQFEGKAKINKNCIISGSHIGFGTFIASYSRLSNTRIGRFCSIGENVKTGFGLHPSKTFVSTHPSFFSLKKQAGFTFVEQQCFEEHKYIDKEKNYIVEIGNDVWLGNDVRIMDGLKIGHGAIVGLRSIVTRNIEPYSINVGVPAKKIGYRFNEEQIQFLLKFKWWNKDYSWLKDSVSYFQDIDVFMDRFA